jgi:hypothetical protein
MHVELLPRPNLSDVEGTKSALLGVRPLGLHDLHVGGPFQVLDVLDGIPEVALRIIGILAADLGGFLVGKLFLSVFG